MDVHTPEQRSFNMSRIKSRDTKPEKVVRSILHSLGYRFRLHAKSLPGSPDIVLPKFKTLIYVHGCFWHRHDGCKYATTPSTNIERWSKKFEENISRDRKNQEQATVLGWYPVVIWECECRDLEQLAAKLNRLLKKHATFKV